MTPGSPHYSLPYTFALVPELALHTYYEVRSRPQPIVYHNYSRSSKVSGIVIGGACLSILILPPTNCVSWEGYLSTVTQFQPL